MRSQIFRVEKVMGSFLLHVHVFKCKGSFDFVGFTFSEFPFILEIKSLLNFLCMILILISSWKQMTLEEDMGL